MSKKKKMCSYTSLYSYTPITASSCSIGPALSSSDYAFTCSTTNYSAEVKKVKQAKLSGAFLTCEGKAVFIKKVIYSDPATIVFWSDGTKTMSKCAPRDVYFEETGLTIAILKKLAGNGSVRNLFAQWMPEGTSEVVEISDARKKQKETEE